jgi:hypothetical protein
MILAAQEKQTCLLHSNLLYQMTKSSILSPPIYIYIYILKKEREERESGST